jgi:hypothetical protein
VRHFLASFNYERKMNLAFRSRDEYTYECWNSAGFGAFVHQILLLSREIAMPMPSLFKYFLTVGGALLGVLFLTNYLLEQPVPATAHNAAPARSVAVKTDPQASRIERWRAEQAAAETARKEEAARLAAQPADPQPAAAQPVKAAATGGATAQTADAALTETPAAEQAKPKAQKARADRSRAKRLAREDARVNARTASNQQDDYYYGQRQGYAQQRPLFAPAPAYAYAPQQSFGPFGGGWGRGW